MGLKQKSRFLKRCIRFLLFGIFLFSFYSCVSAQNWEEIKGDHFIVFYRGSADFAKSVLRNSENYYKRIASDLGYVRYKNFWQWYNRVKIYIYSDKKSFLETTGQPDWIAGYADYTNKEIISFTGNRKFLGVTLPHEIAHLIFRDFVGFKGEVPLWIDEGVAQWEEGKERRRIVKLIVEDLYKRRQLISIELLMRTDAGMLQGDSELRKFYAQSASLVGFLIVRYGADRFVHFCRQLRDGKTLEESLKFTYPTKIRNLKQLESEWLEYVSEMEVTG